MSIHWTIRYSAFIASVFTLSLFFAGWREVNTTGGVGAVALLAGGVLTTAGLLVLQAYWIYFEEKNKGTLKKTNRSFEALHAFIDRQWADNKFVRLIQPVVSNGIEKCNSHQEK